MTTLTDDNLGEHLLYQLTWHWESQLRPRLDGLTDEEYLWEPVPGAWNVRPRDPDSADAQPGTGDFTVDFSFPEPVPAPVTTIAWRLVHIIVGVFGARNHAHFGGPEIDYFSYAYPGTAAEALADLDAHYDRWVAGVRGLDVAGLSAPCGDAEGPWGQAPMIDLITHIHREVIHHGAEIALLRDLFAQRG